MAYTAIDDPSAHFQVAIYTGTGSGQSITNSGNSDLQPDLVWVKDRSATNDHKLTDSSRLGGGSGPTRTLESNTNAAEYDDQGEGTDATTSFNTDGFTIGTNGNYNTDDNTYVAWQWKANGGTTSSVSASGSGASQILASTHQANTTAGFSIILYTGTGETATVSHGLGAVPDVLLFKERSTPNNWYMYHSANTAAPETDYMTFDTTATTTDFNIWNDTAPTSTVCSLSNSGVHGDTETFVCYAFKAIQGYSKFGTYKGNANADGTFVYTGFRPAYVMVKGTTNVSSWNIHDNKRQTYNDGTIPYFYGNDPDAEITANANMDFVSNGFKLRTSDNDWNGDNTYVYAAFAHQPFVTSGGVPCTAR